MLGGRSPLLRLQSDGRLIALLRAGNDGAFDVLFARYRARLFAFCRHMLGSKEDAEDILQDVFAAAYNAILADQRAINVRPWLYRIARNRCLNHLRRPVADGRDTMDDQLFAGGTSAADVVHKRADLRHLLADVQKLAETQRTALLLREIDALSYEQIAEAMETTVPSVKSLLVRARMSLAEASEARQLSCDEVRLQLAEVAEGLRRTTPPLKRHVRECEYCRNYRKQLRKSSVAMAAVFPVGALLVVKKLLIAKAGAAALASGAGSGGGAAATGGVAATATGGVAGGATAGGIAGGAVVGAATSKAIAGIAVTAIIAGGAVEARRVTTDRPAKPAGPPPPAAISQSPQQTTGGAPVAGAASSNGEKEKARSKAGAADKSGAEPKPQAGATGAVGATGGDGVAGSGAAGSGGASPATGAHPPAAANGSASVPQSGGPDTGGAAPPPAEATPPAPAVGTSAAPGSTGPTGTTGP